MDTIYEVLGYASTVLLLGYVGSLFRPVKVAFDHDFRMHPIQLSFYGSLMVSLAFWAQFILYDDPDNISYSMLAFTVLGSLGLLLVACLFSEWHVGGKTGRTIASGFCLTYAFIFCIGYHINICWNPFKYYVFPIFIYASYHGLYNMVCFRSKVELGKFKNPDEEMKLCYNMDLIPSFIFIALMAIFCWVFFWGFMQNTLLAGLTSTAFHHIVALLMYWDLHRKLQKGDEEEDRDDEDEEGEDDDEDDEDDEDDDEEEYQQLIRYNTKYYME
eukprot:TRINITY_DN1571_c0_g1_i1.p1 TRINITY_DN1571_c0_g1~~TRINITY_DN1571_c0_g1_i1.p1  ORF type:complete len:272 (-),score=43.04 TRINITY_DN1571_c0_g1_i1:16-831(-)